MKGIYNLKLSLIVFLMVFVFSGMIYSQTTKVIKHTLTGNGTKGRFSITNIEEMSNINLIKVNEISISVSASTDETRIIFSADITEETAITKPSNVRAVIKSYTDSSYGREEKIIEEEVMDDEETAKDEVPNVQTIEESVPPRTYLEVTFNDEVSTYDFYDKDGLEPIIESINNQYSTNLEVSGTGRNLTVINAAPKKTIEEKTVYSKISISQQEIEEGKSEELAKFNLLSLQEEMLNDKIMSKAGIKNYTLIIDESEMYLNGNKIAEKLLAKYRKIFSKLSFEYQD